MTLSANQGAILEKISSYQAEINSKKRFYYDIKETDIYRMEEQLENLLRTHKLIKYAYQEKLLNRHNQDLIDLEKHISFANVIIGKLVEALEEVRITYPMKIQLEEFDETHFEIQNRDHLESLFDHYEPELSGYLSMKKQSLVVEKERLEYVIKGLRKEFTKIGTYNWDDHLKQAEHLQVPKDSYFVDSKVGDKIQFDQFWDDHFKKDQAN